MSYHAKSKHLEHLKLETQLFLNTLLKVTPLTGTVMEHDSNTGYLPIENYGIIGDCHGCALISNEGSIDWLTLSRFDAIPLLWNLLDDEKGAFLRINPGEEFKWKRYYKNKTNILITEAEGPNSLMRLTDFMPVGRVPGSSPHDYTSLVDFPGLIRKIEVYGKSMDVEVLQRLTPWPRAEDDIYLYEGRDHFRMHKEEEFTIRLEEDHPHFIVISKAPLQYLSANQLRNLEKVTKHFWQEWIGYSQYRGDLKELIDRSALTLKMLIHSDSGAIIAAPTTSLPEKIGGERNWDYRYSWLRDSSFTLYALGYLGFSGEADRYADFMKRAILKNQDKNLMVMYNLDGDSEIPEKIIPEVKGYRGSSPVRLGNGAHNQLQLDTYGEFLDWAYLHRELGGEIDKVFLDKIEETAELVVKLWRQKDRGIWEVRSESQDFTYSKVMCWAALDRAESLLEQKDRYKTQKEEIVNFINRYCISAGRLKRSAQSSELDASLLLIPAVGFPINEKVYSRTVHGILDELANGPFIKRYKSSDGLKDEEGHFLICSFWAANACLFLGQVAQAKDIFSKVIDQFNDLGLMSEEYDARTGHFLGNYPQALTHLAFIETASYFEIYSKNGKDGLKGCHGDRVRHMHKTLHGPKAVWDFLIHTGNLKKLIPSKSSILGWK